MLDARRDKITSRIAALRDLVFVMGNLLGEDPKITYPELFPELIEPETGFTDAVREVLKSSNKYFSPVDIRNELRERGFFVRKRYTNPLAAIHQILKRLVVSDEIEPKDENTKLYKWKNVPSTKVLGSSPSNSSTPQITVPSPTVKRGNGGDPIPVSQQSTFGRRALKSLAELEAEKKDLKK